MPRAPNTVVWYLFCIGFVVCRFCKRCCFVLFLSFWLLALFTGLFGAGENIRIKQRRPNLWPAALTFLGPCETTQQNRGPLWVSALTCFAPGVRPDDTKNAGWLADQFRFWIPPKQGFGTPRNQPIKPRTQSMGDYQALGNVPYVLPRRDAGEKGWMVRRSVQILQPSLSRFLHIYIYIYMASGGAFPLN